MFPVTKLAKTIQTSISWVFSILLQGGRKNCLPDSETLHGYLTFVKGSNLGQSFDIQLILHQETITGILQRFFTVPIRFGLMIAFQTVITKL